MWIFKLKGLIVSKLIELINFIWEHYQKIQSSSVIWSLNMVYLQESETRDKIMDLFMLLCLANKQQQIINTSIIEVSWKPEHIPFFQYNSVPLCSSLSCN